MAHIAVLVSSCGSVQPADGSRGRIQQKLHFSALPDFYKVGSGHGVKLLSLPVAGLLQCHRFIGGSAATFLQHVFQPGAALLSAAGQWGPDSVHSGQRRCDLQKLSLRGGIVLRRGILGLQIRDQFLIRILSLLNSTVFGVIEEGAEVAFLDAYVSYTDNGEPYSKIKLTFG